MKNIAIKLPISNVNRTRNICNFLCMVWIALFLGSFYISYCNSKAVLLKNAGDRADLRIALTQHLFAINDVQAFTNHFKRVNQINKDLLNDDSISVELLSIFNKGISSYSDIELSGMNELLASPDNKRVTFFVNTSDMSHYKVMVPLTVNTSCISCHSGFNKDEMVGAISVSVPVKDPIAFYFSDAVNSVDVTWKSLVFMFGLIGINILKYVLIKNSMELNEYKRSKFTSLRERDELLNVLESIIDRVFIIDSEFNIIFTNAALENEFGDCINHKCFKFFNCEENQCPWCKIDVVDAGLYPQKWEWLSDVTGIIYEVTMTQLIASDNTHLKLVVFKDITNMKMLQKEKEELFIKFKESQKMETLGMLASAMINDFKDTLKTILEHPSKICKIVKSLQIQNLDIQNYIDDIQYSVIKLIDKVNDLSVITEGISSSKIVTDISSVLKEYSTSLEFKQVNEYCITSKIEVVFSMPEVHFNIACSNSNIFKCLTRLIYNACGLIKDEGSITISYSTEYIDDSVIDGQYIERGEYIRLFIKSTGDSIHTKDALRMFDPFYISHSSKTNFDDIGLFKIKSVMKDHKGYVVARTCIDQGSLVEMYFPIDRSLQADFDLLIYSDILGNLETILVVDNDEKQCQVMVKMLDDLNYSAHSVNSGNDVLRYLEKDTVDLLMIDTVLNDMDGVYVFKHIKRHVNPNQKGLLISNKIDATLIDKLRMMNQVAFIKKPFTLRELGNSVKSVLKNQIS